MPHVLSWAGVAAWTQLEVNAPDCGLFLTTWRNWLGDKQRPRLLHYAVVLSEAQAATWATPGEHSDLPQPDQRRLRRLTVEGCPVEPGFHRYLFNGGRVSLTLCVGATHEVVSELNFEADHVVVQQPAGLMEPWDSWRIKTLLRRFRRGTTIALPQSSIEIRQWMEAQGIVWNGAGGHYAPRWEPRLRSTEVTPLAISRCAVIGAGLSGASVARALAIRGWQVDIFDSHAAPAGGASGLPAGLVVPHVSADDAPRSRMSRTGALLMHLHAGRLLRKGKDWQPGGVEEIGQNVDHSSASETEALWHPSGAWVKPAQLVKAWLKHPRIHFCGGLPVNTMSRQGANWRLKFASGALSEPYPLVVVANALQAAELLTPLLNSCITTDAAMAEKLAAFQALHGNLSGGVASAGMQTSFPKHPCNGHGSFIGNVPVGNESHWYAGATFETDTKFSQPDEATVAAQHESNFQKLCELLPPVADALRPAFDSGALLHWGNTRCVTHDRLPLVGSVSGDIGSPLSGLWIAAGMGARGLTFAALCAELLVARIGREPMPLAMSLAKSLDSQRLKRKRAEPIDRA